MPGQVSLSYLSEMFQVVMRAATRGKNAAAEENEWKLVDHFQHIHDEAERGYFHIHPTKHP